MKKITDNNVAIRYILNLKKSIFHISLIKVNEYYDITFDSNKKVNLNLEEFNYILNQIYNIIIYEYKEKGISQFTIDPLVDKQNTRFKYFDRYLKNLNINIDKTVKNNIFYVKILNL